MEYGSWMKAIIPNAYRKTENVLFCKDIPTLTVNNYKLQLKNRTFYRNDMKHIFLNCPIINRNKSTFN